MKYLLATILFLFSFPGFAQSLTQKQEKLLEEAYVFGSTIKYPETIQALLMVESSANAKSQRFIIGDRSLPFGKRSYGVMQIKLNTAKFILKTQNLKNLYPSTEEELLLLLLTNDSFNIFLGTKYFEYLLDRFKSWKLAVIAFNRGPTWVSKNKNSISLDSHPYLQRVKNAIYTIVRPFNKDRNFN